MNTQIFSVRYKNVNKQEIQQALMKVTFVFTNNFPLQGCDINHCFIWKNSI